MSEITPARPTLDPDIEEMLAKAKEAQAAGEARDRGAHTHLDRARRAYSAWVPVGRFRGGTTPEGVTGNAMRQQYVALILDLGKSLKADGWESRVEAIQADSDPKRYALMVLRKAIAGDAAGVMKLVDGAVGSVPFFGLEASRYLHEDLMYEVLGIRPAPTPPQGWEGRYLKAVETPTDFAEWIDHELFVGEWVGTSGNQVRIGQLVRNAHRLIDHLGLAGMPLEPVEELTPPEALAHLRNLRRVCQDSVPGGSGSLTDNRSGRKLLAPQYSQGLSDLVTSSADDAAIVSTLAWIEDLDHWVRELSGAILAWSTAEILGGTVQSNALLRVQTAARSFLALPAQPNHLASVSDDVWAFVWLSLKEQVTSCELLIRDAAEGEIKNPTLERFIASAKVAGGELRHLRELLTTELEGRSRRDVGSTAKVVVGKPVVGVHDPSPTRPEDLTELIAAAVGGETGTRILAIARDKSKTVEERLRLIHALDNQALGWPSTKWCGILGVTAAAVRQTEWWRVQRKRLKGRGED